MVPELPVAIRPSVEAVRAGGRRRGVAVDGPDAQRADIADSAAAIRQEADSALQAGYNDYQNALASVQIFDSPLTSLTGPTG